MDDFGAATDHEKWRFLNHVVANVYDQISRLDGTVHEVAGRQCGIAKEAWMALIYHTFAHLSGDKRDAGLVDQLLEYLGSHLAIGAGTNHEDRATGCLQFLDCGLDGLVFGQRATMQARRNWPAFGLLRGDVLGKFKMNRSGLLFLSKAEGFTHTRGNVVSGRQLVGVLGQRLHHPNNIKNLETALLGLFDWLLPCNHEHWHSTQVGIGASSDQVRSARAKGR
ncbi:hypothetical protein D3C73_660300 [compost metagenome]